jgi:nitroreductase
MDTIEAIHSRRSIRNYTPQMPARALIEAIIWDAAQTPPPFSGQVPWTFNVIEGAGRIAQLGEAAMDYARANHPDEPGWGWVDRPGFKVFWNAPVLIVISGRAEDCCRAGTSLILSAHARGLGTCWVGAPMLWLGTAAARAELKIPDAVEPVSAICLGYADGAPPAPPHPRAMPPVIWA